MSDLKLARKLARDYARKHGSQTKEALAIDDKYKEEEEERLQRRLEFRARREKLADAAESIVLITDLALVSGMGKPEVETQLRAWGVWAKKNKVPKEYDLRISGNKGPLVERLTALITGFGAVVEGILKAAGAGENAEDDAIAALCAIVDSNVEPEQDESEDDMDIDDSDSEDEHTAVEELEGRVDDKWPEGFSSGQMG
jgi:hypothetical protein